MAIDNAEIRILDPKRRNQAVTASKEGESVSDATAAPATDLADVIAGCQQNNVEQMHLLYCQFCRKIYGLMTRMVGQQDAEDLTQQVFLKVFRTIGQFAGRSRFTTWLHRLAINEALQHLRKQKNRHQRSLISDPMDEAPSHEREQENREMLEQALSRLDPQLRAIFLLREVERCSYEEIAEALNVPEGTVGSRLNRARRQLQEHLRESGWEPENEV